MLLSQHFKKYHFEFFSQIIFLSVVRVVFEPIKLTMSYQINLHIIYLFFLARKHAECKKYLFYIQ